LNNLGYVVVNSNAQDLADFFGKANLLGLIPWANVALGFFVRRMSLETRNDLAIAPTLDRLTPWIQRVCVG